MRRDVKEIIGTLMRVIDGDEVSTEELGELSFEAEGELQLALNEAYIKLLEFIHDHELRRSDLAIDREMRLALQKCLDRIVVAWDHTVPITP